MKCQKCQKIKAIKSFQLRKDSKHRRPICYACKNFKWRKSVKGKAQARKNQHTFYWKHRHQEIERATKLRLKRELGLDPSEYDRILKSQSGRCRVCNKHESLVSKKTGKRWLLSVDHDHKTGKIRGLLCRHCNSALAFARDNQKILRNLITYLKSQ